MAEIVKSLLNEKLPKGKLSEVQAKYLRPENCTNLVASKINKQIWQQLRQETRNTDSEFKKAQSLLISGLYAVLQMCNSSSGEQKNALTHTAVLLLSANRDLNLKRRDLICPDLNQQYASLCNPSTTISTEEVSQGSVATIIANQTPFKAGGLQVSLHMWEKITDDPFILDAVTHCHIEFDFEPEPLFSATRPHSSFTEVEQTIIDDEIEKFLQKGIIRLSSFEVGRVISPIFTWPKKIGVTGLYTCITLRD